MTTSEKLRAICRILSNDNERQVFHFKENGDGSVNFRLKAGVQDGYPPFNKLIKDNRISIHSTLESSTFNIIKTHIEFEGGEKESEYYLKTDAIKSYNKFSHIISLRLSNLADEIYGIKSPKNGYKIVSLGKFNPKKQVPIISVLVGNKESRFICSSAEFIKVELISTHFKIVILTSYWNMPATDFADFISSLTSGKALYGDDFKGHEYHFYNGLTNEECLPIIRYFQRCLMMNYFENSLARFGTTFESKTIEFMNTALVDLRKIIKEMEDDLPVKFTIMKNN